jgi:hypothetical protein
MTMIMLLGGRLLRRRALVSAVSHFGA